ncbi:MAG: hypothetical protein EA349_00130 [Halomonadaceae bacterium]|nr:MAG: hypothetical protein EA349_00130 [Halomonadaceae bacterium]
MAAGWVILGTIVQGAFAAILWISLVMLLAAPGRNPGKFEAWVLDTSYYWLPAFPIISAVIVIFLYAKGAGAASYWWYLLPVAPIVLFGQFIDYLNDRV